MPRGQLTPITIGRREFITALGSVVGGGSLLAVSAACGGASSEPTASIEAMGSVRGSVVGMDGTATSIGRIFLLDSDGLNRGVYVDVTGAGTFDFGQVKVGEYQVQYWGANMARVPESLPNPVPITVRPSTPTVVRFQVASAEEDELMDRIINAGDFFFQEQPSGEPNAMVVVKLGTLVCWYNVGSMPHTVSGGPWGDSGALAHGDNFEWVASQVGTFPYRCNFHGARMLATLKVEQ